MYVDDIIGIGFASENENDLAVTRRICKDLLGSGAAADDKTEGGRCIDVIGNIIDLDSGSLYFISNLSRNRLSRRYFKLSFCNNEGLILKPINISYI